MVAAVSYENGLEAALLFEDHINSESFCQILRPVASFGKEFVLFGDNASYHDSSYTKKKLNNYKTKMIKNLVNTPTLNPIETTFLQIKTLFKGIRLNRYKNDKELNNVEMI